MKLFQVKKEKKRIYLDYAAATPVSLHVLKSMEPYFRKNFGNAGAIHKEGVVAQNAILHARKAIAKVFHIRPEGVVFTGSGTESNNLALFGYIEHVHTAGVSYQNMEVISTRIEHPSILRALLKLEQQYGIKVHYVKVDEEGRIDVHDVKKHLSLKTALVTFAYANSEIGTVQPVQKITRTIRTFEREHGVKIAVHLDAAQAPLWLSCELDRLGVDLLSLDAGKCEGPKGIGVLGFLHGISLSPQILGGEQEFGLRAGTENTPLIVGASIAIVDAQAAYKKRSEKAKAWSELFLMNLEKEIDGVVLNGPRTFGTERLPNNINISLPGFDTEYTTVVLDTNGIAASTKSACGSLNETGSNVVRGISSDEARALSTLRFTHSGFLGEADARTVVHELKNHIAVMEPFIEGKSKSKQGLRRRN